MAGKAAVFLLFCAACSAAGTAEAPARSLPREGSKPIAAKPSLPARAAALLERSYTGRAAPTLIVENRFPIVQHVFLDSKPLGEVAPGSRARFDISAGTHSLTSADSANPDDNPVSITETFEPGFSYSYAIAPE